LSFRYGYGAAIASVLFGMIEICVIYFLWQMTRREHD
jgi:ABC-type sugar transport system permease subunit